MLLHMAIFAVGHAQQPGLSRFLLCFLLQEKVEIRGLWGWRGGEKTSTSRVAAADMSVCSDQGLEQSKSLDQQESGVHRTGGQVTHWTGRPFRCIPPLAYCSAVHRPSHSHFHDPLLQPLPLNSPPLFSWRVSMKFVGQMQPCQAC